MSRYVERAENVARFIDVNYNLALGAGRALDEQWGPLVATTGDDTLFQQRFKKPTSTSVIQFLCFDAENPNSIISCVNRARENARTVREIISNVMWEELNKFYHLVRRAEGEPSVLAHPHTFCQQVRLTSHMLVGATDATMSHNEAWHFSRLGRLLERADKTSRIVDVQYYNLLPTSSDVGGSLDIVRWSALLRSTSSLEMYRRQYGRITHDHVADFLLRDDCFPRSMRFCVVKAQQSLHAISGTPPGTFRLRSEQKLGRLRAQLDYTGIDEVIDQGLHEYIDQLQEQLNLVDDAIQQDFFVAKPLPQSARAPVASQSQMPSQSQTQSTNGSTQSQSQG
jgi:uncharacterized alpha-E superfamily protein